MALLTYLLPVLLPIPLLIQRSPLAKSYLKLALYLSSLGLCSIWGLLLSILLGATPLAYSVNYLTARSFYLLTSPLVGIRFSVEGEEHIRATHPAVLVGSHQSMLDILYLGRIFPNRCTILAKKSLRWTPLLGQYMTFSSALFIDRKDPASAIASLSAAGREMKRKDLSLWVFPEGTRSLKEQNTLRQFKRGAFHLAIETGLPIVPVVCENYWRLYRKGIFDGGDLRIRVLPPIETSSLTPADVPDLALRTHEAMVAALRDISRPPSAGAAPDPTLISPTATTAPEPPKEENPVKEVLKEIQQPAAPPEPTQTQVPAEAEVPKAKAPEMGESWTSEEDDEENGAVLVGRPRG